MYLLIDNSDREVINLYLSLNNKIVQYPYRSEEYNLVQAIEDCFRQSGQNKEALLGMAVLVGKGSFTSTRIAVTVANTMAYALNTKVTAVQSLEGDWVEQIDKASEGVFVSAIYSGEPNIGGKK